MATGVGSRRATGRRGDGRAAHEHRLRHHRVGRHDPRTRPGIAAPRGDAAGAWESIQIASVKYPGDNEINRLRADLASGGAATFVQSLNKGGDLEARGEYGAALAWYLDAHRQYPPSKFAQERIDALAARLLPGATPTAP